MNSAWALNEHMVHLRGSLHTSASSSDQSNSFFLVYMFFLIVGFWSFLSNRSPMKNWNEKHESIAFFCNVIIFPLLISFTAHALFYKLWSISNYGIGVILMSSIALGLHLWFGNDIEGEKPSPAETSNPLTEQPWAGTAVESTTPAQGPVSDHNSSLFLTSDSVVAGYVLARDNKYAPTRGKEGPRGAEPLKGQNSGTSIIGSVEAREIDTEVIKARLHTLLGERYCRALMRKASSNRVLAKEASKAFSRQQNRSALEAVENFVINRVEQAFRSMDTFPPAKPLDWFASPTTEPLSDQDMDQLIFSLTRTLRHD